MRNMWMIALAALLAAACTGTPAPDDSAAALQVADGRSIAEAQCAGCHAVGEYGESPNPAAPTFRTILTRYRAEVLKEELIQGIQVSHPMPDFQFNPQGADALIAYLRSVQDPPER
jgi:cytochrome c